MKKFIALVNVSLNANDEYSSYLEDIFLGIYEAENDEEALEKVKAEWDKQSEIENLGDWVDGYDYYIKVREIK